MSTYIEENIPFFRFHWEKKKCIPHFQINFEALNQAKLFKSSYIIHSMYSVFVCSGHHSKTVDWVT